MDFDQLIEYIFPIIFFLIYFGGKLFSGKKEAERPEVDRESDTRLEEVRREIQRKILERQGIPAAEPVFEEEMEVGVFPEEELLPKAVEPSMHREEKPNYAQLLEQKKREAAELKARLAQVKKQAHKKHKKPAMAPVTGSSRQGLFDQSGAPRRAFLLHELLQEPLSIRPPQHR